MDLADQVIIVTGAARGIGRALCVRFLEEHPAAVVRIDSHSDVLCDDLGGARSPSYVCDVTDEESVRTIVASVERDFGRIDLFCANAGIGSAGSEAADDATWQRVMAVNCMAHIYSARAVLPGMLARGRGYLLQTISAAGLLTQLGSAPYAVSKHAALAFAEWLAITYRDRGIRVSCLCPQGVWTDMLDSADPAVMMLHGNAMAPERVADVVVAGLVTERFLILPHPEVAEFFRNKATDYDRWLGGMRKLQRQLNPNDGREKLE